MKRTREKIIAKLTMIHVIDDLGMQTEDEGCSISQIADICQKRKVIYHAMDFKLKLFESNKDTTPANNLLRLICICANNHLYPVTDTEQRETMFKSCSKREMLSRNIKYNRSSSTRLIMELKLNFMCIVKICLCMACWNMFKRNTDNKHIWHTMLNRTKLR